MLKKKDFFELESDEESVTEDTIESEVSAYLNNVKKNDRLFKHCIYHKKAMSKVQSYNTFKCSCGKAFSLGSIL